jgi:uncharacterized damage-inducible protein DinB
LFTRLFKYKSWANDELLTALEALDPVARQSELHAAIRIFNHAYVVDRIFAAHLSRSSHPYTDTNTAETPSLEALREAVATSDQWYVDHVGRMTPALLSESISFTFTDGGHGRMTREEMLIHVVTHGGYHRGAIGRILAQLSIAPPRDVFTGYLHQSEPSRRERA